MRAQDEKVAPTRRPQKIHKDHTLLRLGLLACLIAALLLLAAFPEEICPYDPYAQDLALSLQAPDTEHLLGTDRYGRDMLSRVIMGSQASIYASLALVAIIALTGTLVGLAAGMLGGWPDTLLMRFADTCLAFPGLVLALAVAAITGGGMVNAVLALAAISWPKYARLARSQTLSLARQEFVQAARLAGTGPFMLAFRHILPNGAGQIVITAMLDIGTMMMELAGLSFLGLGAKPPVAEWGSMMSVGRSMLQTSPWTVLAPGAAIFLAVALFNMFGDAVRDYFDVRGRRRS